MKYAGVFLLGLFVGAFLIESLDIYRDLIIGTNLKSKKEPVSARSERNNNQSKNAANPVSPPALERSNTLYEGQTPGCNENVVTNHEGHLNCVNIPIGSTVKDSSAAQQHLFLGVVPNVNAGAITTKPGFRGGVTQDWGYTLKDDARQPGSVHLYVVQGCGYYDGEVTTNPNHHNCTTTSIGWTYPQE